MTSDSIDGTRIDGGPDDVDAAESEPEAGPPRVELVPGGAKAAIEAILMVADAPISEHQFAEALLVPVATVERALDALARDYDGYGDLAPEAAAENGTEAASGNATEAAPEIATDAAAENAPDAAPENATGITGDPRRYAGYTGKSASGVVPPREPRGMELRRVAGGWRLYARPEFSAWVSRFVLEGQTSRLSQAALETLAVIAYRQPVSRSRVASIRGVNVDGVIRTLRTRGLVAEAEEPGESGAALFETTPLFLERIGLEDLEDLPKISPYLPGVEDVGDYEQRT
ncbi:SMC-Scp complex subunit ScpB [Rothia santali]|uniref:SMC-Scp complex subunit ScpB n=1 Tax=Rothia santali TaxID=2949643 RepID=UPI002814FBAD|nr:SMC-Scp complex subunit ScpB [Rothia santali]